MLIFLQNFNHVLCRIYKSSSCFSTLKSKETHYTITFANKKKKELINVLFSNFDFTFLLKTCKAYFISNITCEPSHGKTNNLHMRKQRRRSASR